VAKIENPKLNPSAASNTEKNPDDWVSGDGDAFDPDLSKAEASKRIDGLKKRLGQQRER
jgi:hypothetical protein